MSDTGAALPDVMVGRVGWVFPDDFDVDEIIGVQNIRTFDAEVLRAACMKDLDPTFVSTVGPGDWLVAGRNFGYGHPHDQPMMTMRDFGIAGVIAESFAPLFARGETYNGFPLVTCAGISSTVRRADMVEVEWRRGLVRLPGSGTVLVGQVPGPAQIRLIENGGGDRLLLRRAGGDL
jgi:3-isopropylmalate/(R)-2-methylmalate dehydratase small subunit